MDGQSHPLRNGPSQSATVLSSTTSTTAMAPSHPLNLASSHSANPFISSTTMHHPPTASSQIQIQTRPQPHEEHDLRRGSLANQSSQNASTSTVRSEDSQPTDQPPTFETYPHAIAGGGGPTATAPFLRDFSLVAEAAKRAQMSIVMRDLESVTL
ncbi:hypothetical protein BJX96DRAFT_158310 [Aspergillus floccosus]